KLESRDDWKSYCQSGKKPIDILANPSRYPEWKGMGDWLGSDYGRGQPRAFKEARAFVRKLKFKNSIEWRAYCVSDKRPVDIPTNPHRTYAGAGWIDLSDWLGITLRQSGKMRSFSEAHAFVRKLGFKSGTEWIAYCDSGKKPMDISRNPG